MFLLALLSAVSGFKEIFTIGEAGYSCIKIPYVIQAANGTIIALAEGRHNSCSDFARTDLVQKKSYDGGKTWTQLEVLHGEGTDKIPTTIGNAAPVVVQHKTNSTLNGRLLMPFCRNNTDILIMYSDDNGETYSTPELIPNVTEKSWYFMGIGPPGGLQLSTGRILLPGYAADCGANCNNGDLSKGWALLSDDYGATWRRSKQFGGIWYPNECQAVELSNGNILMNSRGNLDKRLLTISTDGGETWGKTHFEMSLPNALVGCEGSTVFSNGDIYYTGPSGDPFRTDIHLFKSNKTEPPFDFVDLGSYNKTYTAYSSMIVLQNGSLAVTYETSDKFAVVFEPDHTYFRVLDDLTGPMK